MNDYTTDDLLELFDTIRGGRRASSNGHHEGGQAWQSPTPLVDWPAAYGNAEDPARWLAEPLLPDQAAVAIFARGGTGNSLLALWLAADLAVVHGVNVLYLDYEMTTTTVVDRLEAMGHDEPATLGRLHYASLPSLAPLDTAEGGRAVVDMAHELGVALVVIDTFGRAVDGEEDRADTVRAWYRWTGQLLKAAGVGYLRIDHAGKDAKRGQRGSSAKDDDVDVVWEMTGRGHGEFLLRATKRRVDWVAERVVIRQTNDNGVLGYRYDDGVRRGFIEGTADVVKQLDDLGAPVDISRRKAMALLRDAGAGVANNVVADACRARRERGDGFSTTTQYHSEPPDQGEWETTASTTTEPLEYHAEYQSVPPSDPSGTESTHPERVCFLPGLFGDDLSAEP